jgi:hypothetical protein
MARTLVYVEAKNSAGVPVSGGTVTVQRRSDSANITLYTTEFGATTIANPLTTDSLGRAWAWAERGTHKAVVAGSGISTYTIQMDDTPAGDLSMAPPWVVTPASAVYPSYGKCINPQAEATSATTYAIGNLTTPDTVTITVPTDGLVTVAFHAQWKTTVSGNSRCRLFCGATAVGQANNGGAAGTFSVDGGGSSCGTSSDGTYNQLNGGGFMFSGVGANGGDSLDVTTGQAMIGQPPMSGFGGTPIVFFVAAGTYAISVQFSNNAAGTTTVKNRKLWVFTTA